MLVKFPTGDSFTNILQTVFFHMKAFCAASFMPSQFGLVIFSLKKIGAKSDHKMLVKLTKGIAT